MNRSGNGTSQLRSLANGCGPRPVDPVGARQPMEPGGGAAVIYRVRSLAGLEDELAASVVGMWNGAASELNGAVFTLGD
jgi:3-oxoacyl-[acyl-carrier protein] reductase